jgi:hypothetical protein
MLALVLGGVVAAALIGGCASRKTYTTPEGQVTVTGKSGKAEITIKGKEGEGKVEIKGEAGAGMSEEEIGIPFYPGAKVAQTVGWSQEGKEKEEMKHVTLTTPDPVDEVKAFYQKKLAGAQTAFDMTSGDERVVHMLLEQGKIRRMVMISRKKDAAETTIVLQRMASGK